MGYRSDSEDVIAYETDNPFVAADGNTQISAHRSGGGIMPEETMMAFKNCAENENFTVDWFEFDLHITKDNVLVLLHDDTLDRTSDSETVFGEKEVRPEDKTYEELRMLNMGAKFENENGEMPYADLSGEEVPNDLKIVRVEEVLDYLEDVGSGTYNYIIEIKNGEELGKKRLTFFILYLRKKICLTVLSSAHSKRKFQYMPMKTTPIFTAALLSMRCLNSTLPYSEMTIILRQITLRCRFLTACLTA